MPVPRYTAGTISRSALRSRRWAPLLAVLAAGCGTVSSPTDSDSANWLGCEDDADCASLGDHAVCGSDRYCADGTTLARLDIRSSSNAAGAFAGDGGVGAPIVSEGCAAPREQDMTCRQSNPVWSRDLDQGICCAYENACAAPLGPPVFGTEEACASDCRCADVRPRNDFSDLDNLVMGVEYVSLECACTGDFCQGTLEDVVAQFCGPQGFPEVTRSSGCGLTYIASGPNLTGAGKVFDQKTGELVGVSSFTDFVAAPCYTGTQVGGVEFDCPSAETCLLCGSSTSDIPPCDPG